MIKTTSFAFNTAKSVIDTIEDLKDMTPYLAAIGAVFSVVEVAMGISDTQLILGAIKQISSQINDLQRDMQDGFEKVLFAVQKENCYAAYHEYELIIKQAMISYTTYLDNKDEVSL